MKFIADMGISVKSVEFLKQRGHDAFHLHEQGLDAFSDAEILNIARRDGRVVLTHDLDFGELIAASGDSLPSVVIFRLKNMRPEVVNESLKKILSNYSNFLEQGCVLSVTEKHVRVRVLPITFQKNPEK